jgi:hypothetical protein
VHVDAKDLPHYAKTVWLFLLSTARYCCAVETTSIYIEKPENIFFYKTYFSSHFSLLQQMKKNGKFDRNKGSNSTWLVNLESRSNRHSSFKFAALCRFSIMQQKFDLFNQLESNSV